MRATVGHLRVSTQEQVRIGLVLAAQRFDVERISNFTNCHWLKPDPVVRVEFRERTGAYHLRHQIQSGPGGQDCKAKWSLRLDMEWTPAMRIGFA